MRDDRRWALEPLAEAMGVSLNQVCVRLGVSGTTKKLYLESGVSTYAADKLAVRAGFHPFEVWPEMVEHIVARTEQRRADAREGERGRKRRSRAKRGHNPAEVRTDAQDDQGVSA